MATCDSCGASSATLLACTSCQLVSYCGKVCQAKHWAEGGHKKRCRNSEMMMQAVLHTIKIGDVAEMERLLTGYSIVLVDKVIISRKLLKLDSSTEVDR